MIAPTRFNDGRSLPCAPWCTKVHNETPGEVRICEAELADVDHTDGHLPVRICRSHSDGPLVEIDCHLFTPSELRHLRRELDRAEFLLSGVSA